LGVQPGQEGVVFSDWENPGRRRPEQQDGKGEKMGKMEAFLSREVGSRNFINLEADRSDYVTGAKGKKGRKTPNGTLRCCREIVPGGWGREKKQNKEAGRGKLAGTGVRVGGGGNSTNHMVAALGSWLGLTKKKKNTKTIKGRGWLKRPLRREKP